MAILHMPHVQPRVCHMAGSATHIIFHWSVWGTTGDVVEDPLGAEDKLIGKLLTQFLPELTIYIACAMQRKSASGQFLVHSAEGDKQGPFSKKKSECACKAAQLNKLSF